MNDVRAKNETKKNVKFIYKHAEICVIDWLSPLWLNNNYLQTIDREWGLFESLDDDVFEFSN